MGKNRQSHQKVQRFGGSSYRYSSNGGSAGNGIRPGTFMVYTEEDANLKWATSVSIRRLLAIFCAVNMLNYLDRGTIASNGVNGSVRTCTDSGTCTSGSGIQGDFNLNYFEDGILSSAFMVGLMIASPIFASLAKSHNPFRLIGVGLSVWTFATAGCGFSFNFWSILVFRMLVGVGEASFISLAAPFIDDNAPAAQRMLWLGIFYMCIPTGLAIGYVYGGLVGGYLNWRWAFWGEAIMMLPFAVSGFIIKPLQLKGFAPAESQKALESIETVAAEVEDAQVSDGKADVVVGNEEFNDQKSKKSFLLKVSPMILNPTSRLLKDVKVLLVNKVYVINVLGSIAYNFVVGAYSYWGPKAGYEIYHMSDADLLFGGITVFTGIVGTIAGGVVLDRMNSTISNAFKLVSGATLLGTIFCFSSFCSTNLYGFLALFTIGELLILATQAPVNFVCLHSVTPSMRPLSMAMSTVSIHIFGDVPSSPLVGVLQDYINNWRETALILTSILFLASGIWFIGIFFHSVDRFNEYVANEVLAVERENLRPLLDENTTETQE